MGSQKCARSEQERTRREGQANLFDQNPQEEDCVAVLKQKLRQDSYSAACSLILQCRSRRALSLELSRQIRPELLQNIASHVDPDLHAKLRRGVAGSPVVRIVGIRNRDRG